MRKIRILAQTLVIGGALALTGCGTYAVLSESPQDPALDRYSTRTSADTLAIPVDLKIRGKDLQCTVTSVDILGNVAPAGVFNGGEIIGREFVKFADANFSRPAEGEVPVARLNIDILAATSRVEANFVDSSIRILARLSKPGDEGRYWTQEITANDYTPWLDRTSIPPAFYGALKSAMTKFSDEWDRGNVSGYLQKWAGE